MSNPKRLRGGAPKPRIAYRSTSKVAEAAVKHEGRAKLGGDVTLTLRLILSRAQAEQLTARAIRKGKNLNALVAEILEVDPTG